jgi:hypothetical protein
VEEVEEGSALSQVRDLQTNKTWIPHLIPFWEKEKVPSVVILMNHHHQELT